YRHARIGVVQSFPSHPHPDSRALDHLNRGQSKHPGRYVSRSGHLPQTRPPARRFSKGTVADSFVPALLLTVENGTIALAGLMNGLKRPGAIFAAVVPASLLLAISPSAPRFE